MNAQPVARVLVGADGTLFGSALQAALDGTQGFSVVGVVVDTSSLLTEARRLAPDLAVLAAGLFPNAGYRLCRELKAQDRSGRVLLVGAADDSAGLLAALQEGIDGYLTRDAGFADLVAAAHSVLRGETWVPPSMLGGLLRDLIRRRRSQDAALRRFQRLSRREREVLALLTRGREAADVAAELVISVQTARTHIQNVITKLEVHSRVEAATFAHDHELLDQLFPD